MRGRKPKPSHLKLVTGNPGKRKLNKKEPKPRREIPSPPDHLSDRARVAWGSLSAKLDRLGILTELDDLALERVCELVAEIVEHKADIRQHGRYVKVGLAKGKLRPVVRLLADADKRLRAWMTEFGLTPSSRSRINAHDNENPNADPAEAYF